MSEYIVDLKQGLAIRAGQENPFVVHEARLGERLIRCRDCLYYDNVVGRCTRVFTHYDANPDDFCSFVVPKEAEA
jgi:hypothetical protein